MIEAVVWRDSECRTRWWARTYRDGRCDWIQYGFRSARKAMNVAKTRLGEIGGRG
jgi:hypothetical protein